MRQFPLITASDQDPQLVPAVETLRSTLNQASLEKKPADRLVLTGRGLALVQEWDQARIAFEAAVKADDRNAEAWAWLGEARHQTDAEAKADLERAFVLEPHSPVVRGLRGLDFQRAGMFRNALIAFQAAALYDPKNPAWQVSIGETYSKLGDLIRALQAYQAATQLAPEDPVIAEHLGDAYAKQNLAEKAIQMYERALQFDPKKTEVQEKIKKLRQEKKRP